MEFNYTYTDSFKSEEIHDISRCLKNILCIPKGSVPLARELGMSWTNLSKIPADMENDYATEVIEKIEKYEPRVSVTDVEFCYKNEVVTIKIALEKGDGNNVND